MEGLYDLMSIVQEIDSKILIFDFLENLIRRMKCKLN